MTGQGRSWSRYLIDTNIVIGTLQGLPEAIDFMGMLETKGFQVVYSVIVETELFSSHLLTDEDKIDLRLLLDIGEIIDVDSEVALKAAELRAVSRKLYRRRMKLPDALVAATGLLYSAPVVTRNIDDFTHLGQHGLAIINPFDVLGTK